MALLVGDYRAQEPVDIHGRILKKFVIFDLLGKDAHNSQAAGNDWSLKE